MEFKKFLRLNMQFFAEDGAGAGGTGSTEGGAGGSNGSGTNNPTDGSNGSQGGQNGSDSSTLEKLIQSAVDRATNKLGNENKALKKQIDDIMKQKLTDDERVELERKQEREQFEQEKAQFTEERNKYLAVTALAKAELDVSPDKLDDLVSLVIGADEAAINDNVKKLSELVKEITASKVQKTFEDNGRNPQGSGNPSGGKNDDNKDDLAIQLGKQSNEANKKSAEVLKYYTGG